MLFGEGAVFKSDAPDSAVDFVAAGIAEVDFAVLDDGVGPVGNVERAVGALLDVDGAEAGGAAADEVALVLGCKAGAVFAEGEAHDAVGAEVTGDGRAAEGFGVFLLKVKEILGNHAFYAAREARRGEFWGLFF